MSHKAIEVLLVMNDTWLGWLNAKWHDYVKGWNLTYMYPPEDSDSAHSDLFLNLVRYDLSMGDVGLVIRKDVVRQKTVVKLFVLIRTAERVTNS